MKYFGLADYQFFDERSRTLKTFVHNCVTLSIVRPNEAPTEDDVPYEGVGISVRNCKNERFLCHGELHFSSMEKFINSACSVLN